MKQQFEFPSYIEVPNGEPITSIQNVGDRILVFTKDKTFVLREKKIRWYRRIWWRLKQSLSPAY